MEKDYSVVTHKNEKRPKSATRYPKRMPAYVVAFSIHENYDDMIKPQEFRHTQNLQDNISSESSLTQSESNDSTKTFIMCPIEEPTTLDTSSDVNIVVKYDNECGDVQTPPKLRNCFVVQDNTEDEQPQVIFNATKRRRDKKYDSTFIKKKLKKNKHVVTFKNIHLKRRKPKSNVSKRLYKYCESVERNPSLSNIVSRVLKKASAQVNLLNNCEKISLNDVPTVCEEPSQNTLVYKSSTSSKTDDWYSIHTVTSTTVPVPSVPYKTDVLNVAVAVAYNPIRRIENNKLSAYNDLNNNTTTSSTSTFLIPDGELTSQNPSEENVDNFRQQNANDYSNENISSVSTLKIMNKNADMDTSSEDDPFEIARTSSEFNKRSIQSDATLISDSEVILRSINSPEKLRYDNLTYKTDHLDTNLLETVINLGIYPEISPSTSSAINYDNDLNVIVTENVMTSFTLNTQSKGHDYLIDPKGISKNVLKKTCQVEDNVTETRKNINLPDEATIKAIFKEADRLRKMEKAEAAKVTNNDYINMSETWEKLMGVLDVTVKRLEETLADKIIKEIKNSILILLNQRQPPPDDVSYNSKKETKIKIDSATSNQELFFQKDNPQKEGNQYVQCDLVHNKVIDDLVLKCSVEEPRIILKTSPVPKMKKPKLLNNYFEVLKPPAVISVTNIPKGDTTTVSTATPYVDQERFSLLDRAKELTAVPASFFRENILVLTSVPAFLFVFFCLYSVVAFILKYI